MGPEPKVKGAEVQRYFCIKCKSYKKINYENVIIREMISVPLGSCGESYGCRE